VIIHAVSLIKSFIGILFRAQTSTVVTIIRLPRIEENGISTMTAQSQRLKT
jgi:hypothetical protein